MDLRFYFHGVFILNPWTEFRKSMELFLAKKTRKNPWKTWQNNRRNTWLLPLKIVLEGTFQFAEPGEEGAHLLSAAQIYTSLKSKHPAALQDCTPLAFSKLLAQIGKRVHTKYGNGYWVKSWFLFFTWMQFWLIEKITGWSHKPKFSWCKKKYSGKSLFAFGVWIQIRYSFPYEGCHTAFMRLSFVCHIERVLLWCILNEAWWLIENTILQLSFRIFIWVQSILVQKKWRVFCST